MSIIAMIQARCDSSRLPNKVLLPLGGKTVLQQVIDRVNQSKYIDESIVLTSIGRENLEIARLCADINERLFLGSEEDVLDRYYQAARIYGADYIVRITGDCPLIEPELIDLAISELNHDTDYMGMISESFADGLDVEIIKYEALVKSWKEAKLKSEREHMTQYILKNKNVFKVQDFISPVGNFGYMRWTLDEKEDYLFLVEIFNYFSEQGVDRFNYLDVIKLLKMKPQLMTINQKYHRNEGLQLSLSNDRIVENTGDF